MGRRSHKLLAVGAIAPMQSALLQQAISVGRDGRMVVADQYARKPWFKYLEGNDSDGICILKTFKFIVCYKYLFVVSV